jgi:hypothetical protein
LKKNIFIETAIQIFEYIVDNWLKGASTLSITTFSITTLSIMTLSTMGLFATLSIDTQHNSIERHFADCRDILLLG